MDASEKRRELARGGSEAEQMKPFNAWMAYLKNPRPWEKRDDSDEF
jgi:hypothetical protein